MSGAGYGDKQYWDKRYEGQEDKYDWYLGYEQFRDLIVPLLNVAPKDTRESKQGEGSKRSRSELKVLVVGCGNSDLTEAMYDEGFTDILSIDYSEVVIDRMRKLVSSKKPDVKFDVADVREMKYADGAYDVIVDKGTLDAVLCGNDSIKNAMMMLAECSRCLKKGGFLFVVTYGQPQSRLNYLEKQKYKWKVRYENLGKTRFMYIMQKTA